MVKKSNEDASWSSVELAKSFWKLYRTDEVELERQSKIGELEFDVFKVYEASEDAERLEPLLRDLVRFATNSVEYAFIGTTVVEHAVRRLGPDVLLLLELAVPSKSLRKAVLSGVQFY